MGDTEKPKVTYNKRINDGQYTIGKHYYEIWQYRDNAYEYTIVDDFNFPVWKQRYNKAEEWIRPPEELINRTTPYYFSYPIVRS